MLRVLVGLSASLLMLTGCASICSSVMESAIDSASCNNECPGGPGEKECIKKCLEKRATERRNEEQRKRDAEPWPKGRHLEPPHFPPGLDPVKQLEHLKK